MAVTCVDQMLLWHVKPFLVTDAVRACLYVVMAISAARPRLMLWWHFSVLSLGHVTSSAASAGKVAALSSAPR